MTHAKKAISQLITEASVAQANAAAEPVIKARIAGYGFGDERMTAGRKLLEGASTAVSNQVAAVGAAQAASAQADALEEVVRSQCMNYAQVAKVALGGDDAALTTLGLDRTLAHALPQLITAGFAMYDNALGTPAIAEKLAAFGYPAERLTAERAQVAALVEARRAWEMAKGAAQQATAVQDAAMAALGHEMRDFKKIAKVALKDEPQLLEKLGIPVRRTRTAAQRNAGKKAAATRKAKKEPQPVGA